MEKRLPLPPFDLESARQKVRLAENGWNSRDPVRVSMAYSEDTIWRNRNVFLVGREAAQKFLQAKWEREFEYRLIKELWLFDYSKIAVRFAYEWHNADGQWFRSYGNENWQFNEFGLMTKRYASINDLEIKESERKYHWPLGARPDDHLGLIDLGD